MSEVSGIAQLALVIGTPSEHFTWPVDATFNIFHNIFVLFQKSFTFMFHQKKSNMMECYILDPGKLQCPLLAAQQT